MDYSRGFSVEQDTKISKQKKQSENLTSDQQVHLEAFFERCPYPDETQGDHIAKELGLKRKQIIQHWFQYKRTKMSQPELQAPTLEETCVINQECNISDSDQGFVSSQLETEREQMSKVANAAMAELRTLMSMNGPLWDKSSNGEGYVPDRETYANMFPRVDSLNDPHIHEESSKHYKVVRIGARQLVDMLLDSEEWANIFPTIVSKAETVKTLDIGSLDNRTGALQVVYEEMHALSPLVPSRELFFLRCCQEIEIGTWAIAHVSIDSYGERVPDLHNRRLPSGCIISHMPNETCMVVWVEHVEVNLVELTSSQSGLILKNNGYRAERWLCALHRLCERYARTSMNNTPLSSSQKVINSFNTRKSAIRLSDRMVQDFCKVLYKLRNGVIPLSSEWNDKYKIKTTFHENTIPGTPEGTIATAVTSIRLPVPPESISNLLTEASKRSEDVLSCGHPVEEVAHFIIGENRVSIFKTSNQIKSNVMVFQDSHVDPLGSFVVYAPITVNNTHMIMNGEESMVPILPSGFLISEDNSAIAEPSNRQHANNESGGSLLTMAYQLLLCSKSASIRSKNRETVSNIVFSTLQKIKASL